MNTRYIHKANDHLGGLQDASRLHIRRPFGSKRAAAASIVPACRVAYRARMLAEYISFERKVSSFTVRDADLMYSWNTAILIIGLRSNRSVPQSSLCVHKFFFLERFWSCNVGDSSFLRGSLLPEGGALVPYHTWGQSSTGSFRQSRVSLFDLLNVSGQTTGTAVGGRYLFTVSPGPSLLAFTVSLLCQRLFWPPPTPM